MGKRSRKNRMRKTEAIPSGHPAEAEHSSGQKYQILIAMGVLFILLLALFSPVMLSDRTFQSSDRMTSKCSQPFVQDAIQKGSYPLWNPYLFSGMPSFASLSSAPYVDVTGDVITGLIWILRRIIPLTDFTRLFINYMLLGLFLFIWMRSRKMSIPVSLFAAIAIVFIPETVSYSVYGHHTKLTSFVFVPLIFLFVERLLERRNLLYFSLTGLAIGLQLLRAHVQICYYTYIMIGIYTIFWFVHQIQDRETFKRIFRSLGLLLGAAMMGLLVSAFLNLSVWEYSHYSIRGGGASGGLNLEYATQYSFPPAEIATFFIPSFMGYGAMGTYWGPIESSAYPLYFSLIVLMLAGLAFVLDTKNRQIWFLGVFAFLALIISFGKYLPVLYGPMFKILPLFDKFRAPKMIHVFFDLSMIILAGFGLEALIRLTKDELRKKKKAILVCLGVIGFILMILLLILLIGKGDYLKWAAARIRYPQAAYGSAMKDASRAFMFYLACAGIIWMYLKGILNRSILPVLIMVLLVFDLMGVSKKMMDPQQKTNETSYFKAPGDILYLKNQQGPYRILMGPVFDRTQQRRTGNWTMYHMIQNVDGYSAAKLRNYQEFLEAFDMPDQFFLKYIASDGSRLKTMDELETDSKGMHDTFLRLLNVKYFVNQYELPDTSWKAVFIPRVKDDYGVFEYKDTLSRVFFPRNIQVIKPENILEYMKSRRFDPAVTGIVEDEPPFEIEFSDSNRAVVTRYGNHDIEIQADIRTPSLMVLSEIYYPAGWKAFIDDQEAKIYKTDYILRSLFVEPGKHTIKFKFAPESFKAGFIVSIASFLILLSGAIAGGLVQKKKKPDFPEGENA